MTERLRALLAEATPGQWKVESADIEETPITDQHDLNPQQALGVALSVASPTMLMADAQTAAPGMLAHLEAMGYTLQATEETPAENRRRWLSTFLLIIAFLMGLGALALAARLVFEWLGGAA